MDDTVSRSVQGEENENDTWLKFYRHTGLKLKQAGVALMRLDHSGKDESKGQRGGSAKVGDVDAVWRLKRSPDGEGLYVLDCEAHRFQLSEPRLVIRRESGPLRHTVVGGGSSAVYIESIERIASKLDDLKVPSKAGEQVCRNALKEAGLEGNTDYAWTNNSKKWKAIQERRNAGSLNNWSERSSERFTCSDDQRSTDGA